ncbi:MAG: hypothetical protein GX994_07000 [Firmicutes bacterium]|nr:hypothetical protein [Bacillota bacterium]
MVIERRQKHKVIIALFSLLALSVGAMLGYSMGSAAAELPISLGKPVLASTQEGWNPVENAVDGFASTRWAASSGVYPNWVRVDLGSVSEISRVDIKWYDPENRSYKYLLEVSDDDENYRVVVDQTQRTQIGDSSDPLNVSARYVRVTVTGGTGSPSFYEFQVFGKEGESVRNKSAFSFVESNQTERWVGTWAASQQLVEPHNMPPSPGLTNRTLRQVVRVSIGGDQIRLKLSNQYGNSPLTINAVYLAESAGAHRIKPETGQIVKFDGNESITISSGEAVVSDPFDYNLSKLTNMAITINFGSVPSDLTGHPGSRTTSYISPDSAVDVESMSSVTTTDHWYVITGIDILTDCNEVAVVALGDSITDGRGSITNQNNRWTDVLAKRLQDNDTTSHVAVLNHGIGGNAVLGGGLGPTAYRRFERDVLEQSGVRYLIILAGVNDIGGSNSMVTADDLITAYQIFVNKARERNILVYGATILPFGGSGYYTPLREKIRQKVNEWIRTSGEFDAVIDFDFALRDPDEPVKLFHAYDDGDHLHPNAAGYKQMGEVIDLTLFIK